VVAKVLTEFASRLPPGVVQGTPSPASGWCPQYGAGSEAESKAWPSGELPAARSEWVAHVCSP
jgi:hypothetical protein